MGVTFTEEAAKRIAQATRRVERMPRDMAGDRTRDFQTNTGFWAMILGLDISGLKYSFNRVIPDPKSTLPAAFVLNEELRFSFDGEPMWEAGREANGLRGVTLGTVVWMTFVGYGVNDEPVFLFSHPRPVEGGLPPHDHRDNFNGGFAFATYHPGTGVPTMPFRM